MNIFVLSNDPRECAQIHCDKHVVKMIVEYAQLLSTAHRVLDGDAWADEVSLYKKTHVNHPCAVWARQSNNNYIWLHCLLTALCDEFEYRRNKKHSTSKILCYLTNLPLSIDVGPLTLKPLCMPDEYKVDNDPVKSYRNYYKHGKAGVVSWKWGRSEPEFMRS